MTEDKNIENNVEKENLEDKAQEQPIAQEPVSDVSAVEAPAVEAPAEEKKEDAVVDSKEEAPKEEAPKEEAPKEEAPKEEAPKEEAPKEEAPKVDPKEVPKDLPAAQPPAKENPADGKKSFDDKRKRKWSSRPPKRQQDDSGLIEKVIAINRVTKVTKGGKKLSFSALVVVGDGKGKVGYYLGKAPEVATAIQKSLRVAKKNMMDIVVRKGTISHEIIGRCGGATVLLKPASEGTGVIAAGPVRAICDASGIRNILTKCHRSNNPINIIKATVDGLSRLKPFKEIGEAHSVSA